MKTSALEHKRQLFHMLLGILLVFLLQYGIIDAYFILILIVLGFFASFILKKWKIPSVYWLLSNFERDDDLEEFPGKGAIFYLIGVLLVLLFFPLEIAMASIIVMAFGDSVSHIFGVNFGRRKHPFTDKKFLEGMLAGLIAAFIGALYFLPWWEALAAALAGMIAEGIEFKVGADELDDNLVMPLVAAIAVSLIRLF